MAANCGGLAGAQVFRTDDSPLYHRAFTVILSLAAICMGLLLGQLLGYFLSNRKIDKANPLDNNEPRVQDGVLVKFWRWTL